MEETQTQKAPATETPFVKKLTISTLECKPANRPDTGEPLPVARFWGEANRVNVMEDKRNGNIYEPLVGSFAGLNIATGKEYRASTLYLPTGIQDFINDTVREIQKGDPKVDAHVVFAVEIRAVKAANPIGYTYQGVPLIKANQQDRLSNMRANIEKQLVEATTKALPEPAKAGKK